MEIKKTANEISNIIKQVLDKKQGKVIVKKSLRLEKAITMIDIKIQERLSCINEIEKNDLLFIDEHGLTVILETRVPITSKTERVLKELYTEKGYYFSYHINQEKNKYYICVSTK